jgi:hypothetical protein
MTDAEIEACKHPAPPPAKPKVDAAEALRNAQKVIEENSKALAEFQRQQDEKYAGIPMEPKIGMTTDQARAMLVANQTRPNLPFRDLIKWTGDCAVNRTTTAGGVREQWVCGSPNVRTYMYFDNGILTSIQD